jgi:hypothetical protein
MSVNGRFPPFVSLEIILGEQPLTGIPGSSTPVTGYKQDPARSTRYIDITWAGVN